MAQQKRSQAAKPVTAAQIKRIHVLVNKLKVSDENYRECMDSRFGVTSSKALTMEQARSFIAELEEVALKFARENHENDQVAREEAARKTEAATPKRFDELDNRPGMASAAQLRKIEAMWSDLSDIPDPAAKARALRRFIMRIAKVADLRFLDGQMAGWVINALNVMKRQAEKTGETTKPKKAR